jgi:hypothetical protein
MNEDSFLEEQYEDRFYADGDLEEEEPEEDDEPEYVLWGMDSETGGWSKIRT